MRENVQERMRGSRRESERMERESVSEGEKEVSGQKKIEREREIKRERERD